MYNIGDIVRIHDRIDPTNNEYSYVGTIRAIEPDNEISGLRWLKIVYNEEVMNVLRDPSGFLYATIVAETEPCIELLSKATTT